MAQLRIHRIIVKNFRGIETMDVPIPEHGAVFKGKNGAGKSSVLNAIRAALAARDIGENAIRIGTEKAEILVDLGDVSVQRAIAASGSTLKIRRTATGDTVAKPQHFLNELLGTAPLDPADLFLEKDPKKRRAMVLAALPVRVTDEDLRSWIPKDIREAYPIPAPDLGKHGLEVVGEVRKSIYDLRGAANANAKELEAQCTVASGELASKRTARPVPEATPTPDLAASAERAAAEALAQAQATAKAAALAHERTARTREQIAEFRANAIAAAEEAARIDVGDMAALQEELARLDADVERLRAAFNDAERVRRNGADAIEKAQANVERRKRQERLEAQNKQRADELEAAIAGATEAPTPAQVEALWQRHKDAAQALDDAKRALGYQQEQAKIDEVRAAAKVASDRAGRLTDVVDRLTKQVPAELLARSKSIDGLGVDGDSVTLNGVAIDALSGREQLVLAVQIARRLNEKAKILICDGLERLDEEQMEIFVREATAGGFQLIGTRVASGDVVMESISLDEAAQ
jgi:DNA repair exonuclease SbcCD ATPase subunit